MQHKNRPEYTETKKKIHITNQTGNFVNINSFELYCQYCHGVQKKSNKTASRKDIRFQYYNVHLQIQAVSRQVKKAKTCATNVLASEHWP
jgi:hypothetical protein